MECMHADNDVVTFLKIKSQIQWAKFEVDLAYRETSPAQTQNPNYISYYHSLYQFEGANTRKLLYCSLESVCKGKQKKKKNDRWREWQKCRGDKEVDHLLLLQELFLLLLHHHHLLIVRRYTFLSPFLDFSRVANVLHLSNYYFCFFCFLICRHVPYCFGFSLRYF